MTLVCTYYLVLSLKFLDNFAEKSISMNMLLNEFFFQAEKQIFSFTRWQISPLSANTFSYDNIHIYSTRCTTCGCPDYKPFLLADHHGKQCMFYHTLLL